VFDRNDGAFLERKFLSATSSRAIAEMDEH
jgi:hypothetical protein